VQLGGISAKLAGATALSEIIKSQFPENMHYVSGSIHSKKQIRNRPQLAAAGNPVVAYMVLHIAFIYNLCTYIDCKV
jgi:predicted metal-dependent hydrolase